MIFLKNNDQSIKNRETNNEANKRNGMVLKGTIDELKKRLESLEEDLAGIKENYNKERDAISKLQPVDVETINAELQSIESKNSKIRDNITYTKDNTSLDATRAAYSKLDTQLEELRANRLKLIKEAAIPVPGLTFDEDGLLFNDIPLSQCSDGAKLMIGTAISMALNPTMKVLRIKDGSLLGTKNMKILEDLVKEKDFQLWIERVSDKDQFDKSGKVGIFIDEGEIIEGGAVFDKIADVKSTSTAANNTSAKSTKKDEEDW